MSFASPNSPNGGFGTVSLPSNMKVFIIYSLYFKASDLIDHRSPYPNISASEEFPVHCIDC